MHKIEPFYKWRDSYTSELDKNSPFYGIEYSEFAFDKLIYNFYIHPQWDDMGSPSLYLKILTADYTYGFAIIELIGEWNDAINNDIMFLKREVADNLIMYGINKFIIIGENVLNFHGEDDSYYEEWRDDIEEDGGYIALINFREHITNEMLDLNLNFHLRIAEILQDVQWRMFTAFQVFSSIDQLITRRINS